MTTKAELIEDKNVPGQFRVESIDAPLPPAQDEGLETTAEVEQVINELGYHREDHTGKLVLRNPDGPRAAAMLKLLSRRPPAAEGKGERLDGADELCMAMYGRKATPQDYLGGSNARMLGEAARRIAMLRESRPKVADRDAVIEETEQQIAAGLRRAAANWAGEPLRFSREEVFRDAAFHVERGDFRVKPVEAGEVKS